MIEKSPEVLSIAQMMISSSSFASAGDPPIKAVDAKARVTSPRTSALAIRLFLAILPTLASQ